MATLNYDDTLETSGIEWWAHIGGFVYGIIIGFFFRKKIECTSFTSA